MCLLSACPGLMYILRTPATGACHVHNEGLQKRQLASRPHSCRSAYERTDMELEIEREGDEIRIRPARRSLAGVLKKFAQFSSDVMAADRGDHEQTERDAL